MAAGRVLLAIVLLFDVFAPTLLRTPRRTGMDCCPDGETMQCCRNASGCSFETCDGSPPLPLPISITGFVLPLGPKLSLPDLSGGLAGLLRRDRIRPLPDRPDPPPRA